MVKIDVYRSESDRTFGVTAKIESDVFIAQYGKSVVDEAVALTAAKIAEELFQQVLGKVSLDALTNLATLEAGKILGKNINS